MLNSLLSRLGSQNECIGGDTYRVSPSDKANMFNLFFFEQFSDKSEYDIDIDWSNDENYDINFCQKT